jgi:hypothetical protein
MPTHRNFFNRKAEIGLFRQIISGAIPERLLSFPIDAQRGKSWLMAHFADICSKENVLCAHINLDPRGQAKLPYQKIVYKACDGLGWASFPLCKQHLDKDVADISIDLDSPETGGGISIGTGSDFSDAKIGQAVGNNLVSINKLDMGNQQERMAQRQAFKREMLGRTFKTELCAAAREKSMVIIIDTYEQVSEETRPWIEEWLLDPLAVDYSGLAVVIAGRPSIRDHLCRPDAPWNPIHRVRNRLEPPTSEDVITFVREKYARLNEESRVKFLIELAAWNEMNTFGMMLDIWNNHLG